MVQSSPANGRMGYGPGAAWERHDDGGRSSGDSDQLGEPGGAVEALRHQPEDEAVIVAFRRHAAAAG